MFWQWLSYSYGMNNIQYKNAILHPVVVCADYGDDVCPIRVHIEWVLKKKIAVQHNSNHACPSTFYKHKRSFLRLSLGRTVQYNDRNVRSVHFWWTPCSVSVQYVENWPSFACFNFWSPLRYRYLISTSYCTRQNNQKGSKYKHTINTTVRPVSMVDRMVNILFICTV